MSYRVVFPSPEKILPHAIYGDWSVPEVAAEYAYLPLGCLLRMNVKRARQWVEFDHIAAKPGDWHGHNDFSGPRYDAADPRYPGLLVKGMPNPFGLPYRMVDGRRRMHKLRLMGKTRGLFVAFEYRDVMPFIVEVSIDPDAGSGDEAGIQRKGPGLLNIEYPEKSASKSQTEEGD